MVACGGTPLPSAPLNELRATSKCQETAGPKGKEGSGGRGGSRREGGGGGEGGGGAIQTPPHYEEFGCSGGGVGMGKRGGGGGGGGGGPTSPHQPRVLKFPDVEDQTNSVREPTAAVDAVPA
ncbi:hypothetical protein L7F22_025816 [Adiantum nelumboides]|nr:hypothetical protein [Adiantum nelumboides]